MSGKHRKEAESSKKRLLKACFIGVGIGSGIILLVVLLKKDKEETEKYLAIERQMEAEMENVNKV